MIYTVLLGANGTPGLAKQFADFLVSWHKYLTEDRFETCPYLKEKPEKKTSNRWAVNTAIGVGVCLITVLTNVALKVVGL